MKSSSTSSLGLGCFKMRSFNSCGNQLTKWRWLFFRSNFDYRFYVIDWNYLHFFSLNILPFIFWICFRMMFQSWIILAFDRHDVISFSCWIFPNIWTIFSAFSLTLKSMFNKILNWPLNSTSFRIGILLNCRCFLLFCCRFIQRSLTFINLFRNWFNEFFRKNSFLHSLCNLLRLRW